MSSAADNKRESTGGARGALFGAGGRFAGATTDPIMERFNNSLPVDQRMWAQDLDGSVQFARQNVATGILTAAEADTIVEGLEKVREEWKNGRFVVQPGDEDIHTANERRLTEIIGSAVGGKLHTGRSRNDQVATDTRLWTMQAVKDVTVQMGELLETGASVARRDIDLLTAGYTHLQPAQPIRYSHWLCSHLAPLVRDAERLQQLLPRVAVCPLGAGALAGNAFGIDRAALAKGLGFTSGVSANSLDTVCDRDFVVEFLQWASLLLVHISQFAEDVIIMNMLKQVEMSEAYATGSSLMPQKKNPDALELLRGKAGRMLGLSTGFCATLKGLPRAYNKDLQDDKRALFEAVDTVKDCLSISCGVIATMKPRPEALMKALCPEMLATDLADYLVRKGVPFRETHHISGACVRRAEEEGIPLDKLTMDQLTAIDERFDDDVMAVWDYEQSVERKSSLGGTAKQMVVKQIDDIETFVKSLS